MIPKRIALVNAMVARGQAREESAGASQHTGVTALAEAARFALSDLAEAYTVYTKMGAAADGAPGEDGGPLPACHFLGNLDGNQGDTESAPATSVPASVPAGGEPFDALVIALALDPSEPDASAAALDSALDRLRPQLVSNAPVYALLLAASAQPGPRESPSPTLHRTCRTHDLAWHGTLVIADAALLPALTRSPRMGMFRRPVSEAIDRLILAVRTGADAGLDTAQPRVPYPVRRWLTRRR